MRMMIWKELRENFKWAVLALAGLFLAEMYVLSSESKGFSPSYSGFTLCGPMFLMATSFGCALIGSALGTVQVLPELRRDQWAALLHRPVSRSVIFFGKVIAGLLLYFLATAIPFLTSVWYVAVPGHFAAPFVPGMMQPGLSDLLLGAYFYCAAILLCLHRGRWLGSQGMILLSILPVFLLHTRGHFFITLPVSLILILAAWAAMLGNGPVETRPWAGRAAYVLIVLVGVLTGFQLLLGTGRKIVAATGKTQSATYSRFEVSDDGRIFRITSPANGAGQVITDMEGKVVDDERFTGNDGRQEFQQFSPLGYDVTREIFWTDYYAKHRSRNTQDYIRIFGDFYRGPENWYHLTGGNYFTGYDKLSRRCVGIFDQDGFKPPGETPKPFAMRLRAAPYSRGEPTLYASGSRIYVLDVAGRRMTPFFDAQSDTIYTMSVVARRVSSEKPGLVGVALKNGIRIFDDEGRPLLSIPYRHDPARWGNISVAVNKGFDRIYLQYEQSFSTTGALPVFLEELDLQGNVIQSHDIANVSLQKFSPLLVDRISRYCMPLATVLPGGVYFRADPPVTSDLETLWLQLSPAYTAIELGILSALALVLAVITFLWARKTGFSGGKALRWALFVFASGPAGLVTFRIAAGWPVLVRCPSCGKKRLVGNERCLCCNQPWILPELNGTEILDTPVTSHP